MTLARQDSLPPQPACWSWPVTSDDLTAAAACPENRAHLLLWNWQRGMCAVCARPAQAGRPIIRDHDHRTGLIRGLLCQRCNVGEGHTASGLKAPIEVFDLYRARHPAVIVALRARHQYTSGPFGPPLPASFVSAVRLGPARHDARSADTPSAGSSPS